MTDDYLWNASGEPDQEICNLENALRPLRHNRQPPAFPLESPRMLLRRRWELAALTAALTLAVAAIVVWGTSLFAGKVTPWEVAALAGAPRIGSHRMTGLGGRLTVGQILETDEQSRASLTVPDIGHVDVEPHTRLRLLRARPGHSQLSLERGTIHATIWAPPGVFAVDTPGATAVDLGCRYTLEVDDKGAGLLETTSGWVGFKLGNRESFIPAGAACATRPHIGPGTPYFLDAPGPLREAVARFDFDTGSQPDRHSELSVILAQARKRDAVTVWHLLARVNDEERGAVYDRLAQMVPPPAGVTREGVLQLDRKMLDLWWDQLGFGTASWWRIWEQTWSEEKKN